MKKLFFVALLAVVCLIPLWAQTAAEKELIKVEDNWNTAYIKHDAKAFELLYATEYHSTDATGKTYNKVEGIKADASPATVIASAVLSDLKVHIYGQAGVVTGINTIKATADGKDVGGEYRFTDVFVKRDGRWQCVATQGTRIEKK
jgi:ketosteroid isomerase-like protein